MRKTLLIFLLVPFLCFGQDIVVPDGFWVVSSGTTLTSPGVYKIEQFQQSSPSLTFREENGKAAYASIIAKVTTDGNKIPYYESYISPNKPILIYWHGDGQSGNGTTAYLSKIESVAFFTKFYQAYKDRFNIFMPQYPATQHGWNDKNIGINFFKFVMNNYSCDGRVYFTGHSSGGRGTNTIAHMALKEGYKVTAIAIVAGAGERYEDTKNYSAKIPQYIFVGSSDRTVNGLDQNKQLYNWYKKGGGNPEYMEYAGVGHGSDALAYSPTTNLAEWFLSKGTPTNQVLKDPVKSATFIEGFLHVELESGKVLRFKPDD